MVQKLLGPKSSLHEDSLPIDGAAPVPPPPPCPEPFLLPPSWERIHDDKFQPHFIGTHIGYGLFATEKITGGTLLFADKLIWLRQRDQNNCQSTQDADEIIKRKAHKMGPEWVEKFLQLPASDDPCPYPYASIWERHQMPIRWRGNSSEVLGLNLAWLNHSCIPNCILTITSKYPVDKQGQVDWNAKPTPDRALLRACTSLEPGQELTVAYVYTRGSAGRRQLQTIKHVGFECGCRVCVVRLPTIENTLTNSQCLQEILDSRTIAEEPALAFKAAYESMTRLLRCRVHDLRIAMLWAKCAMIAAYHSDLARAYCFLTRARQMTVLLEGINGMFYRQVSRWFDCPTLMPGYGGTTRGLSSICEAMPIFTYLSDARDLLFMLTARPKEYIRVSRYRHIPGAKGERGTFEILPDELEGPKCCPFCDGEGEDCQIPIDLLINGLNFGELLAKFAKKERCIDPEKDFLDTFLEVVNNFLPQPDEGEAREVREKEAEEVPVADVTSKNKNRKKKKKNKSKKGKVDQLVVKDVGAENKVVIVEKEGVLCPDEWVERVY